MEVFVLYTPNLKLLKDDLAKCSEGVLGWRSRANLDLATISRISVGQRFTAIADQENSECRRDESRWFDLGDPMQNGRGQLRRGLDTGVMNQE